MQNVNVVSKIKDEKKKKQNWFVLIFALVSFIVVPAVSLPLLISSNQLDRFGYILAGYWAIAVQIISLCLKEARIWRLRLFDYENSENPKKSIGKWLNILMLTVGTAILCFGIYHAIISN